MFHDRLLSFFSDSCVQTACGHWYCSKVDAASKLAVARLCRVPTLYRLGIDCYDVYIVVLFWYLPLFNAGGRGWETKSAIISIYRAEKQVVLYFSCYVLLVSIYADVSVYVFLFFELCVVTSIHRSLTCGGKTCIYHLAEAPAAKIEFTE